MAVVPCISYRVHYPHNLCNCLLSSVSLIKNDFTCSMFHISRKVCTGILHSMLCLTLREECRLRVFENRVLRVFGSKRDEVTGEWRKLHNEERGDLYSLPNIVRVVKSRRMRWAGHVARMGRGEVCTGF